VPGQFAVAGASATYLNLPAWYSFPRTHAVDLEKTEGRLLDAGTWA
jgi:hypothetical protein